MLSCNRFALDCTRDGLCWVVGGGDVDLAVDDHFKGRQERGLFVYSATFLRSAEPCRTVRLIVKTAQNYSEL